MESNRSYIFRKSEGSEKFTEEEFAEARRYIESREDFRVGNLEYYGPGDSYLFFPLNMSQVQVEYVESEVLENLLRILQPKYYIDAEIDVNKSVLI